MRYGLGLLVMTGLVALAAGQAEAVGIVNGSFEGDGILDHVTYGTVPTGSPAIPGWTVIGGVVPVGTLDIDWVGSYWSASDGARSLYLGGIDASQSGGVKQAIQGIVPGQAYRVTFDVSGNPDQLAPSLKELEVSVVTDEGTTKVGAYPFLETGDWSRANMGWTTYDFDFVAESENSILRFRSMSFGGFAGAPALDNVRIAPVPEPITFLTGLMVVGGLGAYIRRRTRVAKP